MAMQSFNDNWDGVARNRLLKEGKFSLKDMGSIPSGHRLTLNTMGFVKTNDIGGTHLIGRIEASVDDLKKVLGEPHSGKTSDGKSTIGWAFKKNSVVFTVYDYKNPPKSNTAKHTFSLGGKKDQAYDIQRVLKIAGLKSIKEEIEEADGDECLTENFSMPKFIDADLIAKNVRKAAIAGGMKKNMVDYLLQLANTFDDVHYQQMEFMKDLLFHLENTHKKAMMNPNKSTILSTVASLGEIINGLKKTYRK